MLCIFRPNIERLKTVRIYAIYLQLSSDTGLSEMVSLTSVSQSHHID